MSPGKILLALGSSAFYLVWLRSARSLMTVRYGGARFRGDHGLRVLTDFDGGPGHIRDEETAQNSSDYAPRAPFVALLLIIPRRRSRTTRDYSLIVETVVWALAGPRVSP